MKIENTTPERWLPIPGYEGFYEVSDRGQVRSLARRGRKTARIMALYVGKGNRAYPSLMLRRDGGKKTWAVHRLMAMAFLGPSDAPVVRHLDGCSTNNVIANLAWGTYQDNSNDARRHGTTARGEGIGSAKLTDGQVQEIRRCYHADRTSMTCATMERLARRYCVSATCIGFIISRKTWSHLEDIE